MRDKLYVRAVWIICMLCFVGLVPQPLRSDARTDYLINMLENGRNYRIRVQAATTLGKLRSTQAVPALIRALKDKHQLVVISALQALGKVGDPSVMSQIKTACGRPESKAIQAQMEATLRILRALSGTGREPQEVGEPRFLIRVDAMGNSSGTGGREVEGVVRTLVLSRLEQEPDVVLQAPGMGNKQVKRKLKTEKLSGYILSGSIIRLDLVGNQIVVKMSLNVFSNPEYNLLMMPTAEASVAFSHKPTSRERERALQEKGLKAVIDRLVGNIFNNLRQTNNP